jgi:hypothetical protein
MQAKSDVVSMISSNLVSPLTLVAAFGPVMKQRGSGHIVSLCSSESQVDLETTAQSTLKAYMQSIQKEFINTPVRLTTVNIHSQEDIHPEPVPADPQDISDQILFAVTRPRHVQIFSLNSGCRRTESNKPYWQSPVRERPQQNMQNMQNMQSMSPQHNNNSKINDGWVHGEQNWQNHNSYQQNSYQPPYQPKDSYQPQYQPKDSHNSYQQNSYQQKDSFPPVYNFDDSTKPGMNRMTQDKLQSKSPFVVQNFGGPGGQSFTGPGQQSKIIQKEMAHPFALDTTPPPSPRLAHNPVSLM